MARDKGKSEAAETPIAIAGSGSGMSVAPGGGICEQSPADSQPAFGAEALSA